MLRPVKRSGGRRYYRPEDIALLEEIHDLVHAQGYTLRGARQFLESRGKSEPETLLDGLIALRADLAALLKD
jgi:DNA-binding transcriptional MerR regulator